jgi:hypothetical protein
MVQPLSGQRDQTGDCLSDIRLWSAPSYGNQAYGNQGITAPFGGEAVTEPGFGETSGLGDGPGLNGPRTVLNCNIRIPIVFQRFDNGCRVR